MRSLDREIKIMVKNKYLAPLFIAILVLVIIISVVNGCQHEVVDKKNLRKIIFETEILPIFLTNCTQSGCHDSLGDAPLDLRTYDGIMKGIVKGNPSSSKIYSAITATYSNIMPPSGALQPADRAKIRLWIEQGAEDTKADTTPPVDTTKISSGPVCFSQDIFPVLVAGCVANLCHDNASHEGYTKLTTYTDIIKTVIKGNPERSELYQVITNAKGIKMPPKPRNSLSTAAIDSIYNWIKSGANNDSCAAACNSYSFSFSKEIFPIINNICNTCHFFNDYAIIFNYSRNNVLIDHLKGTNGRSQMPPTGKLDTCTIRKVENWVKNGALNN
jgi:hypothetical protein